MQLINKLLRFYSIHFSSLAISAFVVAVFFLSLGLYFIFFVIPDDFLQGELVKIMYIHVPSAWLSLFFYALLGICSILYLLKESYIFDALAKSAAIPALGMALSTLLTGSIWGQPTWGTWWAWDARLTSMLLLCCILIGYFILRTFFQDEAASAKVAAIFGIVGLINLPIIKFSVDIWSTLHQPSSVFKLSGPSIDFSLLYPVFIIFFGMFCFGFLILMLALKSEIYKKKTLRLSLS